MCKRKGTWFARKSKADIVDVEEYRALLQKAVDKKWSFLPPPVCIPGIITGWTNQEMEEMEANRQELEDVYNEFKERKDMIYEDTANTHPPKVTSVTTDGQTWWHLAPALVPNWRDGWVCPKCSIGVNPDEKVCPKCTTVYVYTNTRTAEGTLQDILENTSCEYTLEELDGSKCS